MNEHQQQDSSDDRGDAPAAWEPIKTDLRTALYRAAVWAAFVVVIISAVVVYSNLLLIIDVWFEDRFEPIARAGLATLVAFAAIMAMRWFFLQMRNPNQ